MMFVAESLSSVATHIYTNMWLLRILNFDIRSYKLNVLESQLVWVTGQPPKNSMKSFTGSKPCSSMRPDKRKILTVYLSCLLNNLKV